MAKKSNSRSSARVSATKASRSFSRILDEIERGRRYVVHRHGRDVCLMTPALPVERKASNCLEILRGRPGIPLDDRFGKDLNEVIAGERIERRPWD